jgi:hypothetical protein
VADRGTAKERSGRMNPPDKNSKTLLKTMGLIALLAFIVAVLIR